MRWWLVTLGILAVATPARAQTAITTTDYAIDFYEGVAIGNTAWVGMGGAGAANIVGTAGVLINPSAMAVRPTTDTDKWSWDYHIDFLTGKYSSDYDNNGVVADERAGAQLITGGLGGRYGNWALAITSSAQTAPVLGTSFDARALRFRLAISKWFPARDIAVGLGIQNVTFELRDPGMEPLFQINGTGLIAGITYVPRDRNYRIAGGVDSQILGAEVTSTCPDLMNCEGYILPERVASPARTVVGFAYRFAETDWNQLVGGVFRDEPSVTLTTDLLIASGSPNAYGIEAFGQQELQRSGRHAAVSLRGGGEWECVPGRLRLRGGSYWEPSRFVGIGGRIHGTFGIETRLLEVDIWGRRRGRISFTADVAARYRNIAVSVGFWH